MLKTLAAASGDPELAGSSYGTISRKQLGCDVLMETANRMVYNSSVSLLFFPSPVCCRT